MVDLINYGAEWMPEELLDPDVPGGKHCRSCREYCADYVCGRCDDCVIQECFGLLHRYQSTGLTPEQIREMDAAYLAKCEEVNALKTGHGWIPVAERMPDDPGYYWTTIRCLDGSTTIDRKLWRPEWPYAESWEAVVVAWQPYYAPAPYKPQTK